MEDLAKLFRVLGHEMRLTVLGLLSAGELAVGELAERMDVSMSMLSQQLAVLRQAELVSTRRDGKQVYYTLDSARVAELLRQVAFLQPAVLAPGAVAAGAGDPYSARLGAATFARIQPPR
ncbi:MAG: helix-turn-helix transcriptional regulator [Sphingomonadales bacterium]|nr:helix-turn-helix transcriptional regulator [Sphingomonadales bacterium]MBD3773331.1 helix-turn-helix transcriptional regulator [Paracoccaceae bacterium]